MTKIEKAVLVIIILSATMVIASFTYLFKHHGEIKAQLSNISIPVTIVVSTGTTAK